jgi:tetratricopeptide (TPR) repeat protein
MTLGNSYPSNQRDGVTERVRWFQAAVAVAPSNTVAHLSLGLALSNKGDRDGAEAAFREAIRLDPKYTFAYNNLGTVLLSKGDRDRAEAAYREAIRIDPKNAAAHGNLGVTLKDKGDVEGAIAELQEAIRLDPKNALTHSNLGVALQAHGDHKGAIAQHEEAIRLDPKSALAHNNLGVCLRAEGDLDGAIEKFRESVRLDPKNVNGHNNLGSTCQQKGDMDGAIAAFQEVLKLNPKYPGAQANLSSSQRMRELLPRLPDILAGRAQPKSPAEACEFARFCERPFVRQFAAAVRLYEWAFARDPALVAAVANGHRYDAACYAARAARGDGVNAPVETAERATLRAKAQAWLRDDLTLWKKHTTSANAGDRKRASDTLTHWLEDSDLSRVRHIFFLAILSADEATQWLALWAEVRATRDEALKPPPPPEAAPAPRPKG